MATRPPPPRRRILAVDDDAHVVRALRRLLREHDVVVLTDPREARDRIAAGERFDVILSDMMMPGLSGAELYQAVAQAAPDQATRMIFVTAGATTAATQAFLAGARQPVLYKPVQAAELRAAVDRVLSGS